MNDKRKALGRGLESLLPGARATGTAPAAATTSSATLSAEQGRESGGVREIPIEEIERNPYQTRTRLDEVALHPRPSRSIPIWMGGGNFDTGGMPRDVTIKRAARLADGFKMMAPLGTNLDRMLQLVDRLREEVAAAGRDPDTFGLEGRLVTHVTPVEQWAATVAAVRSAGASHFGIANRIVAGSVADQIALITRVADTTRAEWGDP